MQAPNASPFQPSSLWDRDPVRAAEEEIRKYLLAHRVTAQVQAKPCKGHPALCLLAIYAGLALIIMATLWAVNRLECDPLITDHGFSRVCRWGQESASIGGVMSPPSSQAGDF
jgi:hypothetical protein